MCPCDLGTGLPRGSWGSHPGGDYFILLSQSFVFYVFFIVRVRVRVKVSFGVD